MYTIFSLWKTHGLYVQNELKEVCQRILDIHHKVVFEERENTNYEGGLYYLGRIGEIAKISVYCSDDIIVMIESDEQSLFTEICESIKKYFSDLVKEINSG